MASLRRIRSKLVPDWSRQSEELADLPLADRSGWPVQGRLNTWFGVNVLHGGETWPYSAELQNDFPVEASIPDGGVTLDSILCTEELRRRQCRPPDYQKEKPRARGAGKRAIGLAVQYSSDTAETILDVTQCDSSGLSC